jgi:exosortase
MWPVLFVTSWLLSIGISWAPLRRLVSLSLNDREYSHLLLIPFISLGLMYCDRRKIFSSVSPQPYPGIPLVLASLFISWFLQAVVPPESPYTLSIAIFAMVLAWAAVFLLYRGAASFRQARFALLVLLLMVPIPSPLMDKLVGILQRASAELVYQILSMLGVPMFRQGVSFELPGVAIRIAEECSAIHSFWALVVTGLLLGHFHLRSSRGKVFLTLLVPLVAVFTNALRIVTIYFLAAHVDMGFLHGRLHRDGGVLFGLLGFSILLSLLRGIRKLDGRSGSGTIRTSG